MYVHVYFTERRADAEHDVAGFQQLFPADGADVGTQRLPAVDVLLLRAALLVVHARDAGSRLQQTRQNTAGESWRLAAT